MYQRLIGQMAINERRYSPNTVDSKPEHEVFWAVGPGNSHDLSLLDAEVIHKPVSNPLEVIEELIVGPGPAFKHQKKMVRFIFFGPLLNIVIHQQSVLLGSLSDILN